MPLVIGLLRNDSYMTTLVEEDNQIATKSHRRDYGVIDKTTALVTNNWNATATRPELEIQHLRIDKEVTKISTA
jgi:hypothetical protein